MESPLVSVLLPTFNCANFLAEALESVFAQTFTMFELIIIDDGSTDGTIEIIRQFHDPRVRLITNLERVGLIESLNLGIRAARADLIARFDADDINFLQRLEMQVDYMSRRPRLVLLGADTVFIDTLKNKIGRPSVQLTSDWELKSVLPFGNYINHPTVIMRRDVLIRVGGYPVCFPHAEDYAMWLRLSSEGEFENLPSDLLMYRVHQNATSIRQNEKLQTSAVSASINYINLKMGRDFSFAAKELRFLMFPSSENLCDRRSLWRFLLEVENYRLFTPEAIGFSYLKCAIKSARFAPLVSAGFVLRFVRSAANLKCIFWLLKLVMRELFRRVLRRQHSLVRGNK